MWGCIGGILGLIVIGAAIGWATVVFPETMDALGEWMRSWIHD